MARNGRKESRMNCHHIVLRGLDGLNLFEEEREKRDFWYIVDSKLEELPDVKLECSYLGKNHFHGILHTNCAGMSAFCGKVASSYAWEYNLTQDRKGAVFQGRFMSEPIESRDQYYKIEFYLSNHGKVRQQMLFDMTKEGMEHLFYDPIVLDIPEDLYRQRSFIFSQIAEQRMAEMGISSLEELEIEDDIFYRIQKEAKRIFGNTKDFSRILGEFLQSGNNLASQTEKRYNIGRV